jgi:hypothetical protein
LDLPAGTHMLRLKREGYQVMSVPVTISDGKTTGYATALVPESGGSRGVLPLNVMTVIIALAGTGACFFQNKKNAP